AGVEATALRLRRGRIGGGERFDCGEVRRVFDARRFSGAGAGEDWRFAGAAGSAWWPGADEIWSCGICDRARDGTRGAGGSEADYRRAAVGGGVCELPAVVGGDAAGTAGFVGGLFGVEPRA